MGKFKVNVPTKRYLKKYLIKLFEGNFHLCKRDHHIKMFLFFLLERRAASSYKLDNKKFACDDLLTFTVSADTFSRYGWELPKDKVIQFNDYLEDHFREAIHNFIRFRIGFGIERKKAIEEFADYFMITPDDIDYDSLRMMETRFRKHYDIPGDFYLRSTEKLEIPIGKTPYPYRISQVKKLSERDASDLFR